MTFFLELGLVLGFLIGLAHGVYIYRQRSTAGYRDGVYFGLWTLALWTLFGAYVLTFWLIGAVCMGLARLRGAGAAP